MEFYFRFRFRSMYSLHFLWKILCVTASSFIDVGIIRFKSTTCGEITQNNGFCAVQGRSRSLISVSIERPYHRRSQGCSGCTCTPRAVKKFVRHNLQGKLVSAPQSPGHEVHPRQSKSQFLGIFWRAREIWR